MSGCDIAAVQGEGDLNVGLNVHLGRGPLGRVAGKKASNTDLTYIKKTKTRLYNAKNPCGKINGMENWFCWNLAEPHSFWGKLI